MLELENRFETYSPKDPASAMGTPRSRRSTSSLRPSYPESRSQDGVPISPVSYEPSSLTGGFPYNLILDVTSSEPRDVLQSERTCLTFIRFTTALFFAALGVVLNFQLSYKDEVVPRKRHPQYTGPIAYLLMAMSLTQLVVSGVNYWITINRYAKHKIATYNFNNFVTVVCMTIIVFMLIVISILLLIERYMRES